jgi:hypothetical protein
VKSEICPHCDGSGWLLPAEVVIAGNSRLAWEMAADLIADADLAANDMASRINDGHGTVTVRFNSPQHRNIAIMYPAETSQLHNNERID